LRFRDGLGFFRISAMPPLHLTRANPHLVHVVQRLAPGGIEALVVALVTAPPVVDGLRRTIISLDGSVEELVSAWPRLADIRPQIIALDKRPGFQPGLFLRLARVLRELEATACCSHGLGPLLYGGVAARMRGIRHRLHVDHDSWSLEARRPQRVYRTALGLAAPTPLAVTDAIGDAIAHHVGTRPQILYNGVDSEHFRPVDGIAGKLVQRRRLGLPNAPIMIGSIGRLETVKGHDLLIAATAGLPDTCHLILAGDGSARPALEAQARALNIEHRVHFLGLVSDSAAVLRSLDVFCLPSRAEGLPLALLEAQACGLPIIATSVGGVPAALATGAGILIPPEKSDALRLALIELLALGPAAWAGMGSLGRLEVLARYSLKTTQRAYERLAVGEPIQ
jgi:glycosyltransferase involved in cell wall biosynthesis